MRWKIKYAWFPVVINGTRVYREKYISRKWFKERDVERDIDLVVTFALRNDNKLPLMTTLKGLPEDAL